MTALLWTLWAALYTAFWCLALRAGWAWRQSYAATAARRMGHAMFAGWAATAIGGLAVVLS